MAGKYHGRGVGVRSLPLFSAPRARRLRANRRELTAASSEDFARAALWATGDRLRSPRARAGLVRLSCRLSAFATQSPAAGQATGRTKARVRALEAAPRWAYGRRPMP